MWMGLGRSASFGRAVGTGGGPVPGRTKLVATALSLLAAFVLFSDGPVTAHAQQPFGQVPGFDISWPQCGKAYPPGPVAFAIVGINGGKPFTANPCFLHQYRWAQRVETHPAVYVNTDFPKPGRIEALNGPYGTCEESDDWCRAYNYGHANAREVIARAQSLGITPSMWWLDVEGGNYWTNDPVHNAQVIRGVLEGFQERRLPVGIYGTPYQWRIIAGGYAPGVPVWTAGAQGIEMAARRCANPAFAFAGGVVVMVQYYDYGFDTNYACPGGHPESTLGQRDPHGRPGPYSRSTDPAGRTLPRWQVIPMVGN